MGNTMRIKIAITDDHELILKGFESLLIDQNNISIVGKFNSAQDTLDHIGNNMPDVLLLDINLPDINGIDLCKLLLKQYPELKVIALSNFDETSFVKRILHNGAQGYLLKNTNTRELLEAINAVMSGEQYIQKDIQKKLLNRSIGQAVSNGLKPNLTRREKEVLICISEELTIQETATKLFISPKTVETHRMNLMSKLGARNSAGLIKIAMEKDLLYLGD